MIGREHHRRPSLCHPPPASVWVLMITGIAGMELERDFSEAFLNSFCNKRDTVQKIKSTRKGRKDHRATTTDSGPLGENVGCSSTGEVCGEAWHISSSGFLKSRFTGWMERQQRLSTGRKV